MVIVSTHSLFLVHSKSSKVNETRLKDQFLLLNMKMNDEETTFYSEKGRVFFDVLEYVTSKSFLGARPETPIFKYGAYEKDVFGTYSLEPLAQTCKKGMYLT